MDFESPPSVVSALHERISHGVFGYTNPPESLIDAFLTYSLAHYQWPVQKEWLVWLPGLVQGINLACRAVGQPGEAVITALPVYPPFLHAPRLADRKLIRANLINRDSNWFWDFAALEKQITHNTRLLLLCHPHNPVGRVWRKEELARILELARKYNLVVCSDEIHCDLILDSAIKHYPLATMAPEFGVQTITLMAPSKTYNVAGLGCALAIIPEPTLRQRFQDAGAGLVPHVNLLGYTAAEAAWRDQSNWLQNLLEHLRSNRDHLCNRLMNSSRIRMNKPEATYLAWLDARKIDLRNPLPQFEALGVGLSDGRDFGLPGFVRLNFGCSRDLLEKALDRLEPLIN